MAVAGAGAGQEKVVNKQGQVNWMGQAKELVKLTDNCVLVKTYLSTMCFVAMVNCLSLYVVF
jgi:hypothetical protein